MRPRVVEVPDPLHEMAAAVADWPAAIAPDRQEDAAATCLNLLHDLAAGLAGPDNQHSAWRQLVGIAVVARMKLNDIRWQRRGERRDRRDLMAPGGDNHHVRQQCAVVGLDEKATTGCRSH